MSTFMGPRCTVCGRGITSGPHICGGTPTFAHFQVQATRWQHRCEDIEAAARDLLDAMTRFGPDDSGQLWDTAQRLRALLDGASS